MNPELPSFPAPKLDTETDEELRMILAAAYDRLQGSELETRRTLDLIDAVLCALEKRGKQD